MPGVFFLQQTSRKRLTEVNVQDWGFLLFGYFFRTIDAAFFAVSAGILIASAYAKEDSILRRNWVAVALVTLFALFEMIRSMSKPIESFAQRVYLGELSSSEKIFKHEHRTLRSTPDQVFLAIDKYSIYSWRVEGSSKHYFALVNEIAVNSWEIHRGVDQIPSAQDINLLMSYGYLFPQYREIRSAVAGGSRIVDRRGQRYAVTAKSGWDDSSRNALATYSVAIVEASPLLDKILANVTVPEKYGIREHFEYLNLAFGGLFSITPLAN